MHRVDPILRQTIDNRDTDISAVHPSDDRIGHARDEVVKQIYAVADFADEYQDAVGKDNMRTATHPHGIHDQV